jgi:hypothetical protein
MDATSFTITELTGAQRQLVLQGRAMPYKPLTMKGTMRAEFTWYPGNTTASVQMLGSKEEPTTVSGKWKDRFIASSNEFFSLVTPTGIALQTAGAASQGAVGQALASTQDIVKTVDSIRRAGQLLRVTWGDVIREGILTSFTVTWERQDVASWEMEFTWISQGETQIAPTLPASISLGNLATQLSAKVADLRAAIEAPFNLAGDFLSAVDAAFEVIDDAAFEMANVVSGVVQSVYIPQEAAERTLALLLSVRASALSVRTTVETTARADVSSDFRSVTVSIANAFVDPTDSTILTVGEDLVVSRYTSALKKAAQDLVVLCAIASEEVRASTRQEDLLATFIARAPTDLRDVATQFYGSPDDWRVLLRFNRMTSSRLEQGQLVLVPKQQFQNRGV